MIKIKGVTRIFFRGKPILQIACTTPPPPPTPPKKKNFLEADAARESELKSCRFGQVSNPMPCKFAMFCSVENLSNLSYTFRHWIIRVCTARATKTSLAIKMNALFFLSFFPFSFSFLFFFVFNFFAFIPTVLKWQM